MILFFGVDVFCLNKCSNQRELMQLHVFTGLFIKWVHLVFIHFNRCNNNNEKGLDEDVFGETNRKLWKIRHVGTSLRTLDMVHVDNATTIYHKYIILVMLT